MEHKCPHCGAVLPENAAFCPHCAKDVHPRKGTGTPAPLRKKVLLGLLALVVVIAAGVGIWYLSRPYAPQEFDGVGEVYYETGDKTYQLLVAWPNDRCAPAPDIYQQGAPDEQYRWPSRWYVNDAATGQDAWEEFEPLVEQVTVEVVQDEDAGSALTAESPTHDENYPDVAGVSYLEFDGLCGETQVVWIIQMKNGDVIRVRQNIHVTLIHTYTYDWHDYPMNTLEELQALLNRVATEVQPEDELMRFILTDAACDRKWRMLDPQGRIPPNEWHAVLAYGTNRWLLGLGYSSGIVEWKENATLFEIQDQVNRGGAAVVSGRFPWQGSQIDHMVAVVGTDGDGFILDDPWGDWHDGYATVKGDDIGLRHSEAVQMLKPLQSVKKWAHLVRPYLSLGDKAETKEALYEG